MPPARPPGLASRLIDPLLRAIAEQVGDAAGHRDISSLDADDLCTICATETIDGLFDDGQLASLDCCAHRFCFGCIGQWTSDHASCCPLCNGEIACVRRHGRGGVLERVEVRARARQPLQPTAEELDELDERTHACVACGSGDDDATILLCDSCDSGWHLRCVRPPLHAVPAGEWYCPDCVPTLGQPRANDETLGASTSGHGASGAASSSATADFAAAGVYWQAPADGRRRSRPAARHNERSPSPQRAPRGRRRREESASPTGPPAAARVPHRPRQRQRAAAAPPMRERPPTPATPAQRPVRYDENDRDRPVLRGHSPQTQARLATEWLTSHGHPQAAALEGLPTGPLRRLWSTTSAGQVGRAPQPAHDNRARGPRTERYHAAHRQRDDVRRQRLRTCPRGHRKARNGEAGVRAMLAFEPAAHAAAQYVDVGCLGDRTCTHCAALLWPGEAARVPAGKDREGGTGWRGTLCCSSGAVHIDGVQRSAAIDGLFETPRDATDLAKHARR